MKLSLTQENFNKALSVVGRVVGNRATLPVLANILLKTENNRLRLSATNLEMGVTYWLGGKVETNGAITIPARLLSEYIASLPAETIKLELEKTTLNIQTQNYQSQIHGIEAEEFPSIPEVSDKATIRLPADELSEALSQTVLVASSDDTRPVLNGVYIYNQGATLYLVATDSYRLAEKTIKLNQQTKLKSGVGVVVPARTMAELMRMLSDFDGEVEILIDDSQICFKFGEVELVSRLIDGEFPDYKQLIPDSAESKATLTTADFAGVAKAASLFAHENAGSVTVKTDDKKKRLQIHSVATQVGENTSTTPAVVKGGASEVSLNSRYIIDALNMIDTQELEFSITGKVNPCVLKPVADGKPTDDYIHIIMPLRS